MTERSGPQRVKFQTRSLSPSSKRLIEMAGRPGGVSVGEAGADPGVSCGAVADQLYQLFKRGHIARARDEKVYRYFGSACAAQAFEAASQTKAAVPEEAPWCAYMPTETFGDELRRLRAGSAA